MWSLKMRFCMCVKCLACNTYSINGNYCHYNECYKGIGSSVKIHSSLLYYAGQNDVCPSPRELTLPAFIHYPSSLSVPSTALMNDLICYFFLLCFWYRVSSLSLSLAKWLSLFLSSWFQAAHYHDIHWFSWFPLQLWPGCDFQTLWFPFFPA